MTLRPPGRGRAGTAPCGNVAAIRLPAAIKNL